MNMWIKTALVIVVIVAGSDPGLSAQWEICDATVPTWQADQWESGCGRPAALYEYLLPWHWGAPSVCTGLCPDPESSRSPR